MIELRRAERVRGEFDKFVESHADELLRTGYLMVWDLAEAEDLVQETLLRVAKRWPRARSMDRPVAYARRILTTWRSTAGSAEPAGNESLMAGRSSPPSR